MSEEIYIKYIEDVALEISQSQQWRHALKTNAYGVPFLISKSSELPIPPYISECVEKQGLEFFVTKEKECDEEFDPDLVIFKFSSKEFPDIIRFTGN